MSENRNSLSDEDEPMNENQSASKQDANFSDNESMNQSMTDENDEQIQDHAMSYDESDINQPDVQMTDVESNNAAIRLNVRNQSKQIRKARTKSRGNLRKYFDGKPLIPINQVYRYLRSQNYAKRISRRAAAALIGIIQRVLTELILHIDAQAHKKNMMRINPRQICLAVRNDKEFSKFFWNVMIPDGVIVGIATRDLPQ